MKIFIYFLTTLVIPLANSTDYVSKASLFDMSMEDLLNLQMSSIASIDAMENEQSASSIKVITKKEIEAMGAISFDEIIETVSGIQTNRGGDNVYVPHIGVRGIYSPQNQQILVLINGQRRKDSVQSTPFHYTRRWVPIHNIEKIEIIKGPGSSIYGADAVSGVVNIITSSHKNYNGAKAQVISGGYDTTLLSAQYAKSNDHGGYSFSLHNTRSGLNDENVQYDVQNSFDTVLPSGQIGATNDSPNGAFDETGFEFKYQYKKFSLELDYLSFETTPEHGIVGIINDEANPTGGIEARLRLKYVDSINSQTTYTASIGRDHNEQTMPDGPIMLFEPGTNFGFGAFTDGFLGAPEYTQVEDYITFDLTYKQNTEHKIKFGTGLSHVDLVEVKEEKNFTADLTTPRGSLEDVTDTAEVFMPEISRTSYYFYVQDEFRINEKLNLFTGARYERYNDIGDTTNPRASLVYKATKKLTTRFIYGEAFRAPNLVELRIQNNPSLIGNENLTPEKMESYEVSNNYKIDNKNQIILNLFTYHLKDIISLDSSKTYQNIGTYDGQGIELEYNSEVNADLKLSFNHTIVKVTDQDDHWIPKLATNQTYLGLNYRFKKMWSVSLQQHYFSEVTREEGDPRSDRDSFGFMNMAIHTPKLWGNYQFMLKVNNVWDADHRYSSNYVDINGFAPSVQPSDTSRGRRTFYLGLNAKF